MDATERTTSTAPPVRTFATLAALWFVSLVAAWFLAFGAPAHAAESTSAPRAGGNPAASGPGGAAALDAAPESPARGTAARGTLLFYPCTSCHPVVNGRAAKPLPNDFSGHNIVIESHDVLGEGSAACVACHEDPARDPGKLKLADGSLVGIDGDVSKVCYRCHSEKYRQFTQGVHGKGLKSCTAAGCHDPHSPSWIYAEPLLPFVGTGFQVRAVSERTTFTPLAAAPVTAPVYTPGWLKLASTAGAVVMLGLLGFIIVGRPRR